MTSSFAPSFSMEQKPSTLNSTSSVMPLMPTMRRGTSKFSAALERFSLAVSAADVQPARAPANRAVARMVGIFLRIWISSSCRYG
jgi:hypothetical protein